MFKISLIIPYYTPFDYMEECLNALHANTFYPIHEVVIINDGAPDGERLREFLPTVESRLKFKV
ncbi:MAG: glycosyltransferase, partial [bacterium]|nr:glycosyltransferase [bacterium]